MGGQEAFETWSDLVRRRAPHIGVARHRGSLQDVTSFVDTKWLM